MKKHPYPPAILILMSILWASAVNAQTYELSRQVIGVTGNGAKAGSLQFSMTVGEPVIQTMHGETYTLTQGFHQPAHFLFTDLDNNLLLEEWGVKIYPNPTVAALHLSAETNTPATTLRLMVVDARGAVVGSPRLWSDSPTLQLDCSTLPPGSYFLHLFDPKANRRLTLPFVKIEN